MLALFAVKRFSGWFKCFAFLGISILVAGCATVPSPAGGPVPASASGHPSPATLTALQVSVQRLRDGAADASLALGDRVDVLAMDRIAIDDKGRGLLKFQDNLAVELFRDTKMEIAGTFLDPAGFTLVRLKQTFGHSRVELNAQARARVELDTDYATITTLADNTEFMVCHAPNVVTCMITTRGEMSVEAQGETVNLKGGQATFVLPGKPPEPPTCIHQDELGPWLDKLRGAEKVPALGELVAEWEKQPCPATGQSTQAAPSAAPAATAPHTAPTPSAAVTTVPPAGPLPSAVTPALAATTAPPAGPLPSTATPALAAATVTPAAPLPSGQGMVPIKAGAYTLGGSAADANHVAARTQNLPGSFIDANLVTFAQYQAFLAQTGRPAPAAWAGRSFPAGHEGYPVEGLTLDDARSYCTFVDKRLPSEAEWEAAGRGPGDSPPIYPWGNDPTAGGKVDQITRTGTYPVGSLAFNQSPLGVFDLIGAVWQWVAPPYDPPADGLQILRGGRHGFLQDLTYRQPARPDDERFARFAGVRCAADQVAPAG